MKHEMLFMDLWFYRTRRHVRFPTQSVLPPRMNEERTRDRERKHNVGHPAAPSIPAMGKEKRTKRDPHIHLSTYWRHPLYVEYEYLLTSFAETGVPVIG